MAKFKKGETSQNVINKKNIITQTMLTKAMFLSQINNYGDIPKSLEVKTDSISETSVHRWEDAELGIIKYSWNTAHKEHNAKELATLIDSIAKANKRLFSNTPPLSNKNDNIKSGLTREEANQIKEENEELRVALAEVYRAYMQLLDEWREDKQIDDVYRRLIIEQANILGKHRAWEVK